MTQIGNPIKTITIEPINIPVPEKEPVTVPPEKEPVREPVPA